MLVNQAVDVLRVGVRAVNKAHVCTLLDLVVEDNFALGAGKIEGVLDDVVAELVFEQVGQAHLVRVVVVRVDLRDRYVDDSLQDQVSVRLGCTLKAILDDI